MRKLPLSSVVLGHEDFERLEIIENEIRARVGDRPEQVFTDLIVEAVEFVLDPVRTGRTEIRELDNVEKTFIGLKVEHFLRDLFDAPKGLRDLVLAGQDVDVKTTVSKSWSWMIPPETFRDEEPVLLVAADETARKAWIGLLVARQIYLGAPNRDGKKSILSSSYKHIRWIATGVDWPPNRWEHIDIARFRELRSIKGGTVRAAKFFEENLRRVIDRRVLLALLFDQKDPMKRLRENGGAPDILLPKGIRLLSGTFNAPTLSKLGFCVTSEEFVAILPTTDTELALLNTAAPEGG
ncbi:hypothetical protein JIP62_10055 [Brevundimonas vitis]|uniref:Type II restriction enzyme NaeI domain-containing protein n=1 Tax=Brevundimonas vitisensis TaxID=2800818 RepID=A0ABX7BJW4_9CAUL|nr:NaeI family type II restriction endonuclease [Brevundimonas vitisensis]QQQ17680.1 hypothetical protein JIP62_10055 [Brevundimonas vitisensis]